MVRRAPGASPAVDATNRWSGRLPFECLRGPNGSWNKLTQDATWDVLL